VTNIRLTSILFVSALVLASAGSVKAQDLKLEYHGAGWLQLGRVENSFTLPNSGNDY